MSEVSNIQNKQVLVRVCYDLSLESGDVSRVQDSLPTIKTLLLNQNKLILITHWSRPKGVDKKLSTKKLLKIIQEEFSKFGIPDKIEYIDQISDFETASKKVKSSKSTVFLLENSRFHENEKSKEEKLRKELAKEYAKFGEVFVDEAFPVSHRKEATNYDLAKLLPSFKGLSYDFELENLSKLKENPVKPFMVVMAGAKLETKLPLIQKMLPKADKILLGGKLAFTFNKVAQDLDLGLNGEKVKEYPDLFESKIDQDFYETAKELLQKHAKKLVIPIDFAYGNIFGEKEIFDVGPKTLEAYENILKDAKTIFWNGTLGYYEKKPFDKGTVSLAKFVSELQDAFTVIGGGDTNSAIPKEIVDKFNFASMGGGATLDFLGR
jgi:phosphoglycerate kinase